MVKQKFLSKTLGKKIGGSEKFWVKNDFWSKKMFGPKNVGSGYRRPKDATIIDEHNAIFQLKLTAI